MRHFPRAGLFACIALVAAAQAGAQSFPVPPDLWDRPRSAAAVMSQQPIRQAVAAWLAQPATRLVIHHGPGQEAQLQAEEIRTWLTALALESAALALRSDLKGGEPLLLEVVKD